MDLLFEQAELRKAFEVMKLEWSKQNNYNDYSTNFIYKVNTFEELKSECNKNNCDINYAIHRWYNFRTSIISEKLLINKGCKPNPDKID